MVARDTKKLEAAAEKIRGEVGKGAMLEVMQCDLSNME
jgi:short-subunit dehydrogenase